jgi:two-component system alkaline phosphatase synthesis response regulator PhoP
MQPSETKAAIKTKPSRILVVDDEEDVRNLVAFNLRAAGMDVLFAEDGAEAISYVRSERPDLVVLDLMLPEIDGLSVCEMIRKLPEGSDTPVVMLTAWVTDRARLVGLQAGANDYLTKPFSPRELVSRVQSLLAETSLRKHSGRRMELNQLTIDLESRQVSANGKQIDLSSDEFRMLTLVVEAIFLRSNEAFPNNP